MDQFLSAKKLRDQGGEITARSYGEYEATCDKVAASIGADRILTDIAVTDLETLRSDLGKGKRSQLSAVVLKNALTRARNLFLYSNETFESRINYRQALQSPDKRQLRKVANERGPRMFEAKEIRALLKAAPAQMKAMIYRGINAGFGNSDCGTLPIDKLDFKTGWHHYWRSKTHNERRCPLWPETVEAVREVIGDRTTGLVFVTGLGNAWTESEKRTDNAISAAFRKLLIEIGIYRKNVTTFYSLRRTLETVGATAGEQVASTSSWDTAIKTWRQRIDSRSLTSRSARSQTTFARGSTAGRKSPDDQVGCFPAARALWRLGRPA